MNRLAPPLTVLAALLLLTAGMISPSPARSQGAIAMARQLNPPGTTASDYAASPADSRAIFLAAPAGEQRFELYSAPLAGGDPLKLNAPLAEGARVTAMLVSPSGGTAVYLGQHEGDSGAGLYRVPIAGGAPVPLASPASLGAAINPTSLAFSPDGTSVLFRIETSQFGPQALYRAPVAGGVPQLIDNNVWSFTIAPDSQRVVYIHGGAPSELRSAALDGSGPPVTLGLIGEYDSFSISADSSRVVYAALGPSGQVAALQSQPLAGGSATPIFAVTAGGPQLVQYALSQDGQQVVYGTSAPHESGQLAIDLAAVSILGGNPVPLAQTMLPVGGIPILHLFPSPNGRLVYFVSFFSLITPVSGSGELRSVSLSGGESARLGLYREAGISSLRFSEDGAWAAFATGSSVAVAPTTGGEGVIISQRPASVPLQRSEDGRVALIAGQEFRIVSFDGAQNAEIEVPEGVTPSSFKLAGDFALYLGEQAGQRNLYVSGLPLPFNKDFTLALPLLQR